MEKINIEPKSSHSMTKTTMKVELETRRRVKILAARLGLDMDETVLKAVKCLENTLATEGR